MPATETFTKIFTGPDQRAVSAELATDSLSFHFHTDVGGWFLLLVSAELLIGAASDTVIVTVRKRQGSEAFAAITEIPVVNVGLDAAVFGGVNQLNINVPIKLDANSDLELAWDGNVTITTNSFNASLIGLGEQPL